MEKNTKRLFTLPWVFSFVYLSDFPPARTKRYVSDFVVVGLGFLFAKIEQYKGIFCLNFCLRCKSNISLTDKGIRL